MSILFAGSVSRRPAFQEVPSAEVDEADLELERCSAGDDGRLIFRDAFPEETQGGECNKRPLKHAWDLVGELDQVSFLEHVRCRLHFRLSAVSRALPKNEPHARDRQQARSIRQASFAVGDRLKRCLSWFARSRSPADLFRGTDHWISMW